MKTALLALPLLLAPLAATPAFAQDAHADHAGHDATSAKLTIDTPIETLLADEGAREVVLAELPELEANPYYPYIKGMSLKEVQPRSQGAISEEALANIAAGLAELD